MRLPWLQVEDDAMGACRRLARLLDVPEPHALGIATMLWQWALEIAPDGDFAGFVPETGINAADTGILAAAVCWPVEDSARLVTELQRVGFVETAPRLRVRGLDRYRRAWEKNNRKPNKSLNSGPAVPVSGASGAVNRAVSARQTETETETESMKEGSNASASTPPLQLEALPVKAVKARKPPDPAAEFARFKAACTDDELRVFDAYCTTFAVDMAPDWGLQKLVRQKLKAHTVDELCAAVRGAGRDPWHREKGSSLRALFSDASKVAQLAKRGAA